MDYIYKYEDSMRQCGTLFTENILKLCNYSMCLLSSSISSYDESSERVKEYKILKKKLDTAQESIDKLKSEYNDLTLRFIKSTSFGTNFKETYFNYLDRQEELRLKFIEIISECKRISLRLDDILRDSSNEELNESCNQNTSKRGRSNTDDGFDLSSIPKAYVLLPKLDCGYGDPFTSDSHHLESNSFPNEHAEELCMATAASASKSLEVSSSDLNSDVAVKKCNSTTVLETKKLKNWASSKQNEGSNLSQSLVCKICHQNICNKRMMRRHMFLHEGLKPFECADCGQSFTRKENMKSHIFSMHMPYQSRPYKCDICSKFYSYQRDLKNHRCSTSTIPKKVSDGRQSLVCNICHKHFSHQQSLKRHMLIHEGVKPFECAECGKSFRRKYDMNQHIGQYCSAKLSEFTSADVDDDVTIKERDSTTVLEAKKVEKLVSSKRKKNSILNESCNQNTSKRGRSNTDDGFDFSSIPKVYVSLPKLDWGYGDPLTSNSLHIESNSFSNEHAEEFCTSAAASASKSLEVSSLDSNNDVAVKKCNLKTVFKTKKLKNWASSERNEAPNLGTSLVCNICHQNIGNQDQMRRHMFLHGDLKPFECADCGKSFTRKENMMVHIFSMHMPYLTVNIPYKCDPCNKFYSSLSDLNKNRSSTTLRDHSTQVSNGCQSPVCNICRKNFCNQRNLEKHMLIHEGLKPFKCAECGESFGRKFVMNQHITECHTPYHTRPYNCDVCGKRYAAQYRLNRHKRLSGHYCSSKLSKFTSADVDDSVSVMDCDSTTVLGDKKVRKLVSSKQKKNSNPSQFFVCKVCNRNYSTRHSLKRHLNSHEGLKPFKCAECDRSFARKHDMKQHIIVVHINDLRFLDTRYYCAHCKYRCQSKESLVYHIKRNHVSNLCLDEFSCSTCGKTFKRRYDRKVHEQRVHVEKKCFCCMNCGNRYKHDSGLIKHLELEQCVLE